MLVYLVMIIQYPNYLLFKLLSPAFSKGQGQTVVRSKTTALHMSCDSYSYSDQEFLVLQESNCSKLSKFVQGMFEPVNSEEKTEVVRIELKSPTRRFATVKYANLWQLK